MAPDSHDRPWHSHLTIDIFAGVLSRSIFHPFIAWLIPLCLRAVSAPYESVQFIAASGYASAITLIWMLSVVNKRVAYGMPREVDWDEEIVVITGGASGLGRIIAETYSMRGASVAVMDVVQPQEQTEGQAGIKHYVCDVGDDTAVATAAKQIEKDVCPYELLNAYYSTRLIDSLYSSAFRRFSSITPVSSTARPFGTFPRKTFKATSMSMSSRTSTPFGPFSQACWLLKQEAQLLPLLPFLGSWELVTFPTTAPQKPVSLPCTLLYARNFHLVVLLTAPKISARSS